MLQRHLASRVYAQADHVRDAYTCTHAHMYVFAYGVCVEYIYTYVEGNIRALCCVRVAVRHIRGYRQQYSLADVHARNVNHECRGLNQCFVSARSTVPTRLCITCVDTNAYICV